jgi:hypothetical protein
LPLGEYAVSGTTQPPPEGGAIESVDVCSQALTHDDKTLTAFEVARRVDALPRARTAAKDTAGYPAVSPLGARATAEPAPRVLRLLRGTCSLGPAHAVTDFVRMFAFALLGIVRWARGESVRALESARVFVDTEGLAVHRVFTLRSGGSIVDL